MSKAKKQNPYVKAFQAALKRGESSYVTSDAPHASRHGFASHDRTAGDGPSAKREIFEHVIKLLKKKQYDAANDVGALYELGYCSLKSDEPVLEKTIGSWLNNWKRGIARGAFYPCDVERRAEADKLFKALVAHVAAKKSKAKKS